MKKMRPRFSLSRTLILFLCVSLWSACSPTPRPTPFIPPTLEAPLIEPTFIIQPTKQVIVVQPSPLPTIPTASPTTSPEECEDNLTFIADLTIPDNSAFTFGSVMDKQWLVENSGTCNWNSDYRLKHISGSALGAPEVIALYPARAGTQATIQITFTAPFIEDFFQSEWQAIDREGVAFGDPIYIRVIVQQGG